MYAFAHSSRHTANESFSLPFAQLGIDMLGLNELGLSDREGIPDKLFFSNGGESLYSRDYPFTPLAKRRRRAENQTDSAARPLANGGAAQRWQYPLPPDWPAIVPEEHIATLRAPIAAALAQLQKASAARSSSSHGGKGAAGRGGKGSRSKASHTQGEGSMGAPSPGSAVAASPVAYFPVGAGADFNPHGFDHASYANGQY